MSFGWSGVFWSKHFLVGLENTTTFFASAMQNCTPVFVLPDIGFSWNYIVNLSLKFWIVIYDQYCRHSWSFGLWDDVDIVSIVLVPESSRSSAQLCANVLFYTKKCLFIFLTEFCCVQYLLWEPTNWQRIYRVKLYIFQDRGG